MTKMVPTLKGTLTALVTPFNKDFSIDWSALDALVDTQIAEGIDGLVPCGTTGESATLKLEEKLQVIKRVSERANGNVPILAGGGANSTHVAAEIQKKLADNGATCSLVVTPYYNKPSAEGLYRHYATLLEKVDLPILLYNVPGRTACDLKPEVVIRLAKLTGIMGIKEATADLDRVVTLRKNTPPNFMLLSGDDGTSCPFVLMGGNGVISVTSNIVPKAMSQMIHAAQEAEVALATKFHYQLQDLFKALFFESNPIPIKTALALQGRIQEVLRLPLCEMNPEPKNRLEKVLRNGGWL